MGILDLDGLAAARALADRLPDDPVLDAARPTEGGNQVAVAAGAQI